MRHRLKYEGPWGDVNPTQTVDMPTGSWRHEKPFIKSSKCCQCGCCYLYCPTGSVFYEAYSFHVDLGFCKGCGICSSVCPANAIVMVEEV